MRIKEEIKLEKLGIATKEFPYQIYMTEKRWEMIRHESIMEDDTILLRKEGENIIAYKILNY